MFRDTIHHVKQIPPRRGPVGLQAAAKRLGDARKGPAMLVERYILSAILVREMFS